MFALSGSVSGLAEVDRALRGLEFKVVRKMTDRALKAGAKPIQQAAVANAPVLTAALRKSIKVKTKRAKRKGVRAIMVGTSARWFQGDQFYGAFHEFGYTPKAAGVGRGVTGRFIRRFGGPAPLAPIPLKTQGKVEGKHFVERAFNSHGGLALELIVNSYRQQIAALTAGSK